MFGEFLRFIGYVTGSAMRIILELIALPFMIVFNIMGWIAFIVVAPTVFIAGLLIGLINKWANNELSQELANRDDKRV